MLTPSVIRRGPDAAVEPVAAREVVSAQRTGAIDQHAAHVMPPRDDGVGDTSCATSSRGVALAAKPLARQRSMLPAVDNDDAWQDLLADKTLPSKDERLSTILTLAAHSTSQVARRANRDGAAHVELLDAAQELLWAMEVKKTVREDERRLAQTDQSQPSPQVRRRHAIPATPPRTTPEHFESAERISSVLSGLETKLRRSLGETASAVAVSCASLSARPATAAATARGIGSQVKALARSKSPQRPSTARDADPHHQYQAWRNLTPAHTKNQDEDKIFRAWAAGAESAAESARERRRNMPTNQCDHQAAAKREAHLRISEQVSGV